MKVKSIMVLASMAFAMMWSWSASAVNPWKQQDTIVCTTREQIESNETYSGDFTAGGKDSASSKATVSYRKSGIDDKSWKELGVFIKSGLAIEFNFNLKKLVPDGIGVYDLRLETEHGEILEANAIVRIEPSVYHDIDNHMPSKIGDPQTCDILLPWKEEAVYTFCLNHINTNNLSVSDNYQIYVQAYKWTSLQNGKSVGEDIDINLGSLTKNDIVEYSNSSDYDGEALFVKKLDLSQPDVKNFLLHLNNTYNRYCVLMIRVCIKIKNTDGTREVFRTQAKLENCKFDIRREFADLTAFKTFVVNLSPNCWGETKSTESVLTVCNLTKSSEPRVIGTINQFYDSIELYNQSIDYFKADTCTNCWHQLKMTDNDTEHTEHPFNFSIGNAPPIDDPNKPKYDERDLDALPLIVSCDYGVSDDGMSQGTNWNIGVEYVLKTNIMNYGSFETWVKAAEAVGALGFIRTDNLADFADESTMTFDVDFVRRKINTYASPSNYAGVVTYSLSTNSLPFVKAAVITVEPVK